MDSIAEQPSLRLELGSMEDLPTIFHRLQEQFPPDEFYNYERMEQMMHHNQYKILLYKRGKCTNWLRYRMQYGRISNLMVRFAGYFTAISK